MKFLLLENIPTITDKFKNNWLKATFETIRMLLPNNVFEDFQLRFFTNKIGQLFKIFKYGFRRIETEEAPW